MLSFFWQWLARRRRDREALQELQFHVEMFVEQQVRAGRSEAEARRRARLELGDPRPVAEELAERRPGASLEAFLHELQQASRGLRHSPGFTLAGVLLVALGVGSSTAMFTLVERVLRAPLPFPASQQLVRLFETNPAAGVPRTGVARGNLAAWRAQSRQFSSLGLGYAMGRTFGFPDGAAVVQTAQVSCDFLPLLGVRTLHGRTFLPEECRRATYSSAAAPDGPDPVVVLGPGLWRRRFGGDPAVVGRGVTIERRTFTVVGVLEAELELPEAGVEAFLPWQLESKLSRDQRYAVALGRLRPGATPGAAQAELDAIATRLGAEHPETNRGWGVSVEPLQEEVTAAARPALWALWVASGLLLLIACGNLAILAQARGAARAREAALCLALGAPRGRLLLRGLLEAALLAGGGGLLGALLAAAMVSAVPALWPDLPRLGELRMDGTALGFALLCSLAAAALAGLLPAWRLACSDPRAALGEGARSTPAGGVRNGLVVAEVALTVVLLAGAGLLLRSVLALRAAETGFSAQGVLVAPIFLDAQAYGSRGQASAYYARLLGELRALPGVQAVGAATTLPTSSLGPDFQRPVWPAGEAGEQRRPAQAWVRMITPGYLEALRIPVVEGRSFGAGDGPDAEPVLAVSEALARALWPGESALGKSLVVDYGNAGTYPYRVVGVIADVRFRGPRSEPLREVFFPHAQRPYLVMHVAVRAADAGPGLAAAVRGVLRRIDPQLPPQGLHRLADLLGATYLGERRAMHLLVGFAVLACLLSGIGLHGLLAYRVRLRGGEIAVRLALGAGRARILSLVAGDSLRLVARGAAIGVLGALAGGRLLEGLLYGVRPADPLVAAGVLLLSAALGVLAAALPAWRAASVEPASALRRS